jgi:dihydroxyacetone kinase-like protein
MSKALTLSQVAKALAYVAQSAMANAEKLRELDAATGDGDLGVTMTVGWKAVLEALPQLEQQGDIGKILAQAGMTFNRAAASTFGVLLATAMMRAGRQLQGKAEATLEDLMRALEAALQGVKERGKADVGDKTMLDAMAPALAALQEAASKGQSLPEALAQAAAAAEEGAAKTAGLKPRFGRAAWLGERAAQVQDPGATAVALMLRALADFCAQLD